MAGLTESESAPNAPVHEGKRSDRESVTINCARDVFVAPHSRFLEEDIQMAESVYKIIELVGTSKSSWEKAAAAAVSRASKSLRDLRVAEITQFDMTLKDGKVETYRVKLKVSFKFEGK